MGGPATKLGSLTGHAGVVIGPGCPTVLINGTPAIRVGADTHICPMVTPGTPPVPHKGMNNIGPGVPTVIIGKLPASTVGDNFLCVGPPAPVITGSVNVFIGTNIGGGSSGSKSTPETIAAENLLAGTVSPIKGTEHYPIEIQAFALVLQQYCTPEGEQVDLSQVDAVAQSRALQAKEESERVYLTIADIVEILTSIESQECCEAARFFASELEFNRLCEMTKAFVDGENTDPNNNPSLMPTRFMILYGADDSKLKEINSHPDNFDKKSEHQMNVTNLQKAFQQMGYDIRVTGIYDRDTLMAHRDYIKRVALYPSKTSSAHVVKRGETIGAIAHVYGLATWKYLYQINKEIIGENPDMLKPGIEIKIPQWDSTSGDEKLKAKGANVYEYTRGYKYRYPWTPFSFSLGKSRNQETCVCESFGKKKECVIKNSQSGHELFRGEISTSDQFEELIPDCPNYEIIIDGLIYK